MVKSRMKGEKENLIKRRGGNGWKDGKSGKERKEKGNLVKKRDCCEWGG